MARFSERMTRIRLTTEGMCLAAVALLSVTACSSGPPPGGAPTAMPSVTDSRPATGPGGSSVGRAAASSSPDPAPPSWHFTVTGSTPVPPSGSQDTHAAAESACDSARFSHDKTVGAQVTAGFIASGRTGSAALLQHFLAGRGTPVSYGPDSRPARLARESAPFTALNQRVTAAVARQLRAGATRVRLSSAQLPPVTFKGSGDLYWGFRDTQGLTAAGTGTRRNGHYTGTLTYVIRDSYGFPAADALGGFGPPMRYLQTSCGAPAHPGGAHWFPDAITVTVPFAAPRS